MARTKAAAKQVAIPVPPVTEEKQEKQVPPTPMERLAVITDRHVTNSHAECKVNGINAAIPSDDTFTVKAELTRDAILPRIAIIPASASVRQAVLDAMLALDVPKHAAIDAIRLFTFREDTVTEIPDGITGGTSGKPAKQKVRKIKGSLRLPYGNTPQGVILANFGKLHGMLAVTEKGRPVNIGMALLNACDRVMGA